MSLFQYLGPLASLNTKEIMEKTQKNRMLQGQPFRVGYGIYSPYTTLLSTYPQVLGGIMVDLVTLFAKQTNMTVEYIDALPENEGIWSKQ